MALGPKPQCYQSLLNVAQATQEAQQFGLSCDTALKTCISLPKELWIINGIVANQQKL